MFKSVRLKLTFINITVVGVILFVFFAGIYVTMRQDLNRQLEKIMFTLAGESRRRPPQNFPPQIRSWNGGFFVRLDKSGEVKTKSPNISITDEELTALIETAGKKHDKVGIIKLGNESFRFFRSFFPDSGDTTIVFMSTQTELQVLSRLKIILLSLGFAGLVIVFVSSLFLANKALIPIKKSWERQQNFVADASHELRSPLAVIQTNLELVMGNPEESVESQSKWLENIRAENKRMAKLVDDLLLLARADSNQKLIEKKLFSPDIMVSEVVSKYKPITDSKEIELKTKISRPFDFFGDEGRIRQLLIILLDNAIKHTPAKGTIWINLSTKDGAMELSVSDTGEGIPENQLDKIFERFYRVDKARSRESGGTGLGLSIASWIAKEHSGKISVQSSLGKGSTFTAALPGFLSFRIDDTASLN